MIPKPTPAQIDAANELMQRTGRRVDISGMNRAELANLIIEMGREDAKKKG